MRQSENKIGLNATLVENIVQKELPKSEWRCAIFVIKLWRRGESFHLLALLVGKPTRQN